MMMDTMALLARADALDFGNPDKPVSSRSQWSEMTWRLDTHDPGWSRKGIAVRWRPGHDGREPPSPAELAIIEDMKRLAWVGLFHPGLTFVKKVTGVPALLYGFDGLLRFMTTHALRDFAALTPEMAAEFVQWTADDMSQREERSSGEARVRLTARKRLSPLVFIWKARRQLQAVGVAVPIADPLGGRSALNTAKQICDWMVNSLPAVPEEAFVRIVNAAANVVLVHAHDVLRAQKTWLDHTGGFGTQSSRKNAADALAAHRCTTRGATSTPWPHDLLDPMINPDGGSPTIGLRRLITTLRDACVIVILATTGLRMREIIAIPGGRSFNAELPDCVTSEVSADGLLEAFSVTSQLTKGQIVPLETNWLVGSRPNGIGPLPLAARAIDVLETLMAPWRVHAADDEARSASIVLLPTWGMPRAGHGVHRMTADILAKSLYDFYKIYADLKSLPDISSDLSGTDLRRIKDTDGRCINARQYRKNYAQYLLRIDSGLLPAIRNQLHHMRVSTTQTSYTGNDPRALSGPDDEQRLQSTRSITALLGIRSGTGGRLADIISAYERTAEERDYSALSVENVSELGLMLIPGEYGSCGIAFAPHLSRCNAKSGRSSFLNVRPDQTHRNPTTCAGCPVFAFDASHRPFWLNRWVVHRDIWENACSQGAEAYFRVAEARMKQAAAFLEQLERGAEP